YICFLVSGCFMGRELAGFTAERGAGDSPPSFSTPKCRSSHASAITKRTATAIEAFGISMDSQLIFLCGGDGSVKSGNCTRGKNFYRPIRELTIKIGKLCASLASN